MRCTFFISLYILSAVYTSVYAFTPTECLQQLSKLGKKRTSFTGRDHVYCSYINRNTIREASFNIKNSKIEDWDITIGQWNKHSLSVETSTKPNITKDDDKYKLSINVNNINAIVWVSNNANEGEIDNVKLRKTFDKRDEDACDAFKSNTFIWKDISWDNTNEKYIGSEMINLNNTAYLDTLALQFRKSNDRGTNHYFTGDFTIAFKIKSDSADWMVYCGSYDEETKEVKICHEWDLSEIELEGEISVSTEATAKLSPEDSSECKNNIIWWQNIKNKNDQNSQRIWLSNLTVQNCYNDDDEEEEGDDDEDGDDEDD